MADVRKTAWFALAALLLVLVPAPSRADDQPRVKPETAGLSADKLKAIDARIAKAVEDNQIAGAVVLVARKDKVGYLQAVGMADIEAKRPMAPDTLFRIMSMTKPITSVAVMMCVDDGKIGLDDPVSKYLPEFKDQKVLVPGKSDKEDDFSLVPAERQVTIRDLLRHTSGLIYPFPGAQKQLTGLYTKAKINPGIFDTKERLADNIKRLGRLPLAHQPGKAFTYGLSTDVLGRVVEVASGKDLEEFFRERIFTPLGMKETFFLPPKDKADRVALLYRSDMGKKLVNAERDSFAYHGSATYFSGGAGLYSTAGDYARFLQMLLSGGEANGARLLKADTVKQMTQNQLGEITTSVFGMGLTPVHGDGFGLGFGVVTPRAEGKTPMSVGSYSWAGAYYSYFWVDPSKQVVAVLMAQAQTTDNRQLWKDFAKLTYEALAD